MPSVLGESALGPLRTVPRDGDGDGRVGDGTAAERKVPRSPPLPMHGPVGLRRFGDAAEIRSRIMDRVRTSAAAIPPITNQRHTLTLEDVGYEGAQRYGKADWKKAILGGRSLGTRLRGTWVLKDNATGKVVEKKRSTVATVPYLTDHGTFIQNGTEYTLAHQLRLRPGVFTRIQANGELEAHVNVMPGQGLAHRIFMEPETGVFRLKVGQSKMPLTSLLRTMGASDRRLHDAWGDLYQANMLKDDPSVIAKLHARLVRRPDPAKLPEQEVREAFEGMGLDPEVTRRTLGKPYDRVSLDQMLDTTKKLAAINRGEGEPDDRDHLAYMTALGPEDLLSERVGRDRMLLGKVLWKASMTNSLKHVQPELLTRGIHAAILSSGLGQPTEGINPAMIFDQQARISRLGVGGIPSLDAIPAEARNVQPSHFGLIDPLVTPESLHVGVDSRAAQATMKGDDGRLYAPFRNMKTGRIEHRSPQDLTDATIAFPGEMQTIKPFVSALVGGRIRDVPRAQVQYELPSMDDAFSAISNLVPLKSTVQGQREVMAGRMLTQALPVANPQAPLMQAGIPGRAGESYEAHYGRQLGALRSDVGGVVEHVDPVQGTIRVRGDDGQVHDHELYINYPYNRKTYIHQTPTVGAGDRVAPGGLLARSNYTDEHGVAAIGQNARTAYVPFRGLNFEDAIVVSESMAKRMSSEHMYQHSLDHEEGLKPGKNSHVAIFPGRYDRRALDTLDADGVVKPGTIVNAGDPLILAVKQRERTHGAVSRGRSSAWADHSETWKHHAPGEVTDVEKTPHGIVVSVKSLNPMEVGDKMSGRYGDKGVVSSIVPDHEMPHDAQGRPFEVLLNPLGIITRANPAQSIETALGKVSERTGKPYAVPDFDTGRDYNEWAIQELAKHGMKSAETIHDPVANRDIPRILTGSRWFMKLHHTSESKGQGRGTGGYTAEGTPARGGEAGSKRISLMDINALLSHGATEVLRDAGAVRGQAHPEFWQQFMAGQPMPTPKTPMVHDKFLSLLKAGGINVVRQGTRLNAMALSSQDVDALSGDREVRHGDTVDWKAGLKPLEGGLFDEALTGGHGGNRWAHIKLAEPLPNPAMEEPIRRMLGLTKAKFEDVIAGKEPLDGRTGPDAIGRALDKIDVDGAIAQARADIRSGRKGARDAAVRKLGYLKTAKKLGLHPRDWMLDKVPVLPPVFRPVSTMAGSKMPLVADANYLYKEVIEARDNLRDMKGRVDDVSEERAAAYGALKAVAGLGDPLHPKNRERGVRGVLKQVFGGSPKSGMVQRKLLASATDLVGRATIVPNPDLDMDQVGLPETRAWDVYQPFIVRRLVRRGMARIDAVRAVRDRKPEAREAMAHEMDARPVIINRAPVHHRYGIMAFRPRLEQGDTLHVSPLIVAGFGADFDGDAMAYHVPATDEAVKDAYEKMLPSRNLLAVSNFKAHNLPSREYAGGLYAASTGRADRRPRVFATRADALAAYRRGDINADQPIEVVMDR
jgi:DNA-directed RNA polymerase subunit beta